MPCAPLVRTRLSGADFGVAPLEESVDRPGVDDPLRRYADLDGAGAAVPLPVELARRVRIRVDGEQAAQVQRHAHEVAGRVQPVRAAVDLDRHLAFGARREHGLVVELALWPGLAGVRPR